MKYFILGDNASKAYGNTEFDNEEELNDLVEQIKDEGALVKFDDLHDPAEVVEALVGWMEAVEITEEEYNTLSDLLSNS